MYTPKTNKGKDSPGSLAAGVPLGSIIPRVFTDDSRLVVQNATRSASAERYRRLCSKLEQSTGEDGKAPQVILVTSAIPHEGKTTTILNLALAMAEDRDRRVLLVDADLRRPSVARYLSPAPKLGLSEALAGSITVEHALIEPKNARLVVLPAGTPPPNPLELLRSEYLSALFADLRRSFDAILVDTPPAVPFADAVVMAPQTDAAVLVIRSRTTACPLVHKALEALEAVPVLGAVLNDVAHTPVDRYYYRYDAYDPYAYAADRESSS
jgi:capsular exopolysaccharide synthesis family protein